MSEQDTFGRDDVATGHERQAGQRASADDSHAPAPPPDGIGADEIDVRRRPRHRASVLSLALLGAILATGLSGLAGNQQRHQVVGNADVELTLDIPGVIRNGEIFETRLQIVARQHIDQVVVGVEPSLWRGITVNSTLPTAADERYADGLFRFGFDALEPGQEFVFQIAQQINPNRIGSNRGRIVVLDGDKPLAETRVAMKVLP